MLLIFTVFCFNPLKKLNKLGLYSSGGFLWFGMFSFLLFFLSPLSGLVLLIRKLKFFIKLAVQFWLSIQTWILCNKHAGIMQTLKNGGKLSTCGWKILFSLLVWRLRMPYKSHFFHLLMQYQKNREGKR